ncbi:MAG: helix-hairpin-helix domain-containing protein [Burkholderiales bacterium]|nr:helix-hairpin-helix domain-containing protein [Burkholderiales bacterium]
MPRHPPKPSAGSSADTPACTSGCPALRPARRTVARKETRARRERSPLEVIPGVGMTTAAAFNRLSIFEVGQLKGQNPQRLYDDLCALDGEKHDRCVLYVFRCAVYYASRRTHDREKLKWWNWKDT